MKSAERAAAVLELAETCRAEGRADAAKLVEFRAAQWRERADNPDYDTNLARHFVNELSVLAAAIRRMPP